MVPTLHGRSLRTACRQCQTEIWFDPESLKRLDESLVCSLCGATRPIDQLKGARTYEGDIIEVARLDDQPYQTGELIAIARDETVHVKRVAAVEGDKVSVQQRRLLVNEQRLEDLFAQQSTIRDPAKILVDDDSTREQSRWRCSDGRHWQRVNGCWLVNDASRSNWLIYHHRNVHDHNRPSGIYDDYQYNAAIARQLDKVDRLSLTGVLEIDSPIEIHVAFWSASGAVLAASTIDHPGDFEIDFFAGRPIVSAPVSEYAPVAIHVIGGRALFEELKVSRSIEYRLRAEQDESSYPIEIDAGQLFVVGDNVPFSTDSRDWGSVDVASVLGRVRLIDQTISPKREF